MMLKPVVFASVVMMALMTVELGMAQPATTSEVCRNTITAMQVCLPYATGKAASPTPECCNAVNTTVQHNKECLCEFIALVHQGSPQIKQLGVQEAKLAMLPSACDLPKNVSASNCPKLSPTSAPSASNINSTSNGVGYKAILLNQALPIQALIFLAMIAFIFPFPNSP